MTNDKEKILLVECSDNFEFIFNTLDAAAFLKLKNIIRDMPVSKYYNSIFRMNKLYPKERNKIYKGDIDSLFETIYKDIIDSQKFGEELLAEDNDYLDYYFAVIYPDRKKDCLVILQIFNAKKEDQGRMMLASFVAKKNTNTYLFWDEP